MHLMFNSNGRYSVIRIRIHLDSNCNSEVTEMNRTLRHMGIAGHFLFVDGIAP